MSEETHNDYASATAPQETVCSEEEFAEILVREIPPLVHIDELVRSNKRARLSRRLLATVAEESAELEDLLTDYDASYNQTYARLFELVAALQSFSAAGYTVKGLELRSGRSRLAGSADLESDFARETRATLDFVETGVRALLAAIGEEARVHCGSELIGGAPTNIMQERLGQKKLPHTVGADDVHDLDARVASEASLYLAALKTLNERSPRHPYTDLDAMRRFVLEVCDEEQARFFEAKLANIQSRYDTFIVNSRAEQNDSRLRRFRHLVGTSRELIRLVTLLVHFYERHEDDLRSKEAKEQVAELVDKHQILDRILNYGLYYAQAILNGGEDLARRLLDEYTTSKTVELQLPEGVMIHARPASLIVRIVTHHGTPVEMTMGSETCYAGSITQVIMLAGSQLESRSITFTGDVRPIEDLAKLFECGLGENGLEELSRALPYLAP
jgi:phosphotransferase system HPr-like phosphotransfer protein